MKKTVILFFLLFALLLSVPSMSSFGQVEQYITFFLCKDYVDLPERDQFYYIAGMHDMLSYLLATEFPSISLMFEKETKDVSYEQIKMVLDDYIKKHPEQYNIGVSSVFYLAISEAYIEESIKELEDFSKTIDEEYISDLINEHSIDYLKELANDLEHNDHAVRWQAIIELEELGTSANSIIPDLIKYLDHNDWYVRYYTVEILGFVGLGDESAIQAVKKVSFSDPNEMVREKAEWVFSELSGGK